MLHKKDNLKQKTVAANIRLNWTFTPKLSLQLFLQPLFAVGNYGNFKELAEPGTINYNHYDKDGAEVQYDDNEEVYNIDPDGSGPAEQFSIDNPDQ
jgi:hypothetical protein